MRQFPLYLTKQLPPLLRPVFFPANATGFRLLYAFPCICQYWDEFIPVFFLASQIIFLIKISIFKPMQLPILAAALRQLFLSYPYGNQRFFCVYKPGVTLQDMHIIFHVHQPCQFFIENNIRCMQYASSDNYRAWRANRIPQIQIAVILLNQIRIPCRYETVIAFPVLFLPAAGKSQIRIRMFLQHIYKSFQAILIRKPVVMMHNFYIFPAAFGNCRIPICRCAKRRRVFIIFYITFFFRQLTYLLPGRIIRNNNLVVFKRLFFHRRQQPSYCLSVIICRNTDGYFYHNLFKLLLISFRFFQILSLRCFSLFPEIQKRCPCYCQHGRNIYRIAKFLQNSSFILYCHFHFPRFHSFLW